MTSRPPIRPSYAWLQKLCIALIAASGSLLAGVILPLPPPSPLKFPASSSPHQQGLKVKSGFLSIVKTLERSQEEQRTIAIALEKQPDPKFAFSAPEPFEGKIVRQAKLLNPEPVIALTLDDGPWPNTTEQVLDILQQYDIKATFFWVGKHLKAYPKIAQKVVDRGHVIGNHTWSHLYHQMNEVTAAKEIEDTAKLIYQTTGVKTSLFRPPGGNLSNGLSAYAQKHNYTVVIWSVDSSDYRVSASAELSNVLRDIQSGSIVLLHDGGGDRRNTIEALPTIITELKTLGYKFVTVPELLQMQEEEEIIARLGERDRPPAPVCSIEPVDAILNFQICCEVIQAPRVATQLGPCPPSAFPIRRTSSILRGALLQPAP